MESRAYRQNAQMMKLAFINSIKISFCPVWSTPGIRYALSLPPSPPHPLIPSPPHPKHTTQYDEGGPPTPPKRPGSTRAHPLRYARGAGPLSCLPSGPPPPPHLTPHLVSLHATNLMAHTWPVECPRADPARNASVSL